MKEMKLTMIYRENNYFINLGKTNEFFDHNILFVIFLNNMEDF